MSAVETTIAQLAPTGTWTIDPVHSHVEFAIKHSGVATIRGRFGGVEGTLAGGDSPRISGTIQIGSVDSGDETRDTHLLSPDFFDVERYPTITFRSTAVERRSGELVVHGELTIKGTTRPVELRGALVGTGVDPMGSDRIALGLETTIDRTDFGLSWNAPLPGGGLMLPNEVSLTATFAAVRAA
jgi:polyisoprenoid-binding protein YceI